MDTKLNEYCLYHIISFLKPDDWMQLSQVCRLWKLTASKQWKKITTINYSDSLPKDINKNEVPILSAVDAAKVILCAAPFVKIFKMDLTLSYQSNPQYFILNEQYYYKVENMKIKTIFTAMAKKATQITEVLFNDYTPKARLVKRLFKKNKITRLKIVDHSSFGWYRNIPTHEIVELDVTFKFAEADDKVSFKNLFPKLKKLTLNIDGEFMEDPEDMLSQILPYVAELKSLDLSLIPPTVYTGSSTLFKDVIKLSELEELSCMLLNFNGFESSELFFDKLYEYFPKLRVLAISSSMYVEKSIKTMLSHPRLENFECELYDSSPFFEVPETTVLSELHVHILCGHYEMCLTGFFEAVKKMRQLKKLEIDFWDCNRISQEILLDLVFGVTKAALALGKDVLVKHYNSRYNSKEITKQVRITKLSDQEAAQIFEKDVQTLQLSFHYESEETLFEGVKALVRTKFPLYNAFVLENKK